MIEENESVTDHLNLPYSKYLCLTTKTWSIDSNGLFDYESTKYILNKFRLRENTILTRQKSEVFAIDVGISEPDDLHNEGFLIQIIENKRSDSIFYTSSNTNNFCKLNKYDINKHVQTKSKYFDNKSFYLRNSVPKNLIPDEDNIKSLDKRIWYVLPMENARENVSIETDELDGDKLSVINKDYFLQRNDIVRFGRVYYVINEMHITKNSILDSNDHSRIYIDDYNLNLDLNIKGSNNLYEFREDNTQVNSGLPVFNLIYFSNIPSDNDKAECKICFSSADNELNPLVSLCKCTGGLKYAHYECIQKWMKTKLKIKLNENKTVTSYYIKQFNCEICKSPYPYRKEKIYDLIQIERPIDKNYLILESLAHLKDNKNMKSIHVIKLKQDEKIIFGRSNQSDVVINDISVSRSHAVMLYNDRAGTVYLRDLNSKFGSLVLLKDDVEIKSENLQLQIGRTIIQGGVIEYKMNQLFMQYGLRCDLNMDEVKIDNMNVHKFEKFCFDQDICMNNNENSKYTYFNLWNTNEC